jgi:hypothetical protein
VAIALQVAQAEQLLLYPETTFARRTQGQRLVDEIALEAAFAHEKKRLSILGIMSARNSQDQMAVAAAWVVTYLGHVETIPQQRLP